MSRTFVICFAVATLVPLVVTSQEKGDKEIAFGPEDKVESESITLKYVRDSHHVIQSIRGVPAPPPADDEFPYSYGAKLDSIDASAQYEIVAFDKDTINLRGPRGGLGIILKRIAQIDVPENESPEIARSNSSMTGQIIAAFAFGIVFVIVLIVLAIAFPRPTPFQYNVFRIVLALAGAGVAAMIPGFIDLQLNPTIGLFVRAGGALAVFVILFFFNPAQLALRSGSAASGPVEPPEIPDVLPNGQPFPADKREPFIQVWRSLIAADRTGSDLWDECTDQTISAFADRHREAEQCVADNALFFSTDDYEALKDALRAADFYLSGKINLSCIRNGTVYSDRMFELAGPGEKDRLVDAEVRKQIQQNKRWFTRYRNLLADIRSRFHNTVAA